MKPSKTQEFAEATSLTHRGSREKITLPPSKFQSHTQKLLKNAFNARIVNEYTPVANFAVKKLGKDEQSRMQTVNAFSNPEERINPEL